MSVNRFFQQLKEVSNSTNNNQISQQLAGLLSVDISNQNTSALISSLQHELQLVGDDQLSQMVESLGLFGDDWSGFNSLVISYLKLCRDINPWSLLESHDLYLNFMNDLYVPFVNNQFGVNLIPLLHDTMKFIIPWMINLDKILNTAIKGKQFKRLITISTFLSKVFNHIKALKGTTQNAKRDIIFFILNKLTKIYFIIDKPDLCSTIFNSMDLLNLKFSKFPKSQQIEYRFILGRFYLTKNEIYKSFHNLNWCYENANSLNDELNKVKILRYLIPMGLLLEKFPNQDILFKYQELNHYYSPLITHLKNGNYYGFQSHLFQNQSYFQKKGLLLVLVQHSKILLFKNLLQKTLLITNSSGQFRLSYEQISTALSLSIKPNEQTHSFGNQYIYQIRTDSIQNPTFIENICSALIENDLMRGKIARKAEICLLSKRDPFPNVFNNYQKKFGIGSNKKWMDL